MASMYAVDVVEHLPRRVLVMAESKADAREQAKDRSNWREAGPQDSPEKIVARRAIWGGGER